FTRINPEGEQDMAWHLHEQGFLMTLSSKVPEKLASRLAADFKLACSENTIDRKQISQWAIHTGGRKILEEVQKSLELSQQDMDASFSILKAYGNMSSPSILFVLKRLLHEKNPENTMALAFGPGLTMEGMYLET